MKNSRAFGIMLVLGLLVGAGSFATIIRTPEAAVATDSPILVHAAAPTSTTAAPTTTAAPAPAPAPAAPAAPRPARARTPRSVPKDPYAAEPIQLIGRIEIPKIGLNHDIYEGITMRNIDRGPSHWPGTAMPGEVGNAVFAGHRVTRTKPFRNIDQLVEGDEVIFTVNNVRSVYSVTGHEIVNPDALWIADQTPTPTATIFACHPPGSAKQRYVVRMALQG